ncbi:dihydrofolate reductase family protein [Microbacterium sp. 10M-3C3]|jgi:riboflavin biosynthesis pyrimidine reductase|uniref:dihydrofolate reductase family protein n=1 Tax=Microbacterium sp. 10M-3C3 TaxID=2483401 RepID=UPI000F640260|nr:dihydrofolate reductase family protein [Microbacterium sp. 10M-3C3]
MHVRDALAAAGGHDVSTEGGRAWLTSLYARDDDAYVRLNMITSPTGAASGADGTSETLTSPTDRALLRIIRAHADAVVVGAATVRAEGYIVPRAARLAIVTTTGDLDGNRFDGHADAIVLVCPEGRVEQVRARSGVPAIRVLGVPGGESLEPRTVVEALAGIGLTRLVCEGGPTLAARFAESGVIDEYCVSVAPVLEPAREPFLPISARVPTTLAGMLVDDAGFSYLRLRRAR